MFDGLDMKDLVTYNTAMNACASEGLWQQAKCLLLMRMAEEKVKSNSISYTTAIDACANAREWQAAVYVLFLHALPDAQKVIAPFNSTINASCKAERWVIALNLSSIARDRGLRPGQLTLNLLTRVTARGRQWERVLRLLQSVEMYSVADRFTWTAVALALSSSAWMLALELRASFSTSSASAAVLQAFREHPWHKALQLLEVERRRRILPDVLAYEAVIEACRTQPIQAVIHLQCKLNYLAIENLDLLH